jgi:23S rRNA (uracil1939-C5)-methyltransferase
MGRKQKPIKIIEGLEITSIAAEGYAIGRDDNQVVFVKYAAPGDIVDVKIVKKKKNFKEGQIIRFQQRSPLRVDPFCPYFTHCGGCKWQHMPYESQLQFKQQQVIDALERIGGIQGFEVVPILGSQKTQAYRNKLELTFSDRAWMIDFVKDSDVPRPRALGFHMPGQFNQLIDIEACYLMPDYVNQIQRSIKAICDEKEISFHDVQRHEGLMRNVMFRCNEKDEWMLVVAFYENDLDTIETVMSHIKMHFDRVVSLNYIVNTKMNDAMQGCEVIHYSGAFHLTESLGDYTFIIQPLSFFQTNTQQAKRLYDITKDFAGLKGSENVYDLYTGTGSIAIYVSEGAKSLVGIEYVEVAIEDAKINATNNGVNQAVFYAGDMKDVFSEALFEQHGKPDVIITDPPREGMHPDVVSRINESGAQRVVYVSCNPATQARDIKGMQEHYRLVKVQPVDMFPHTHHVENVALLERI